MTNIQSQLDQVLALAEKATPDWRARAHGVVVGGEFNEYTNGKAQSQVASFTVMSNSDNAIGEQVANTELAVAAVNFLRQYGPAIRAAVGGEAVAWHTEDHLTDKSATTYDRTVAGRWINKGWPVTPLYASPPATVDVVALRRALAEYPDKNPQQLQAKKVCSGVLKLAVSYANKTEENKQ